MMLRLLATMIVTCLLLGGASVTSTYGVTEDPSSGSAEYRKAVEALDKGQGRAAIIHLRNAIRDDPNDHRARLLLGKLRLLSGEPAAAEKELRLAIEAAYTDETEILLGRALLEQFRYQEVIDVMSRDALIEEDAWSKLLVLGDAYRGLRQLDVAERLYRQVLAADPEHADARQGLASVLLARDQRGEAEAQIADLLGENPDYAPAWVFLGELALLDRDWKRALDQSRRALEIDPNHVQALVVRTRADLGLGELHAAAETAETILTLRPGDAFGNFLAALAAFGKDDYLAADNHFAEIEGVFRNDLPVLLLGGMIKFALEDFAQSERLFSAYLQQRRDSVPARRVLGLLLLLTENPIAAADVLLPLTEAGGNRDEAAALYMLAEAYLRLDWGPQSARILQRISAERPSFPMAQSQIDGALIQLAQAAGLNIWEPDADFQRIPSGLASEVIAVLEQVENGRTGPARTAVLGLRRAYPDNSFVLTLEGQILELRDSPSAARASYERALVHDPEFLPAAGRLDRLDIAEGRPEGIEERMRALLLRRPHSELLILRLANYLSLQQRTAEAVELLEQSRENFIESTSLGLNLMRTYILQGNLERLNQVADEMLITHEGDLRVLESIRAAMLSSKQVDRAIDVSRRMTEADPRSIRAQLLLAEALVAAGEKDDAWQALEKARTQEPDNVDVLITMIGLALEEDDTARALDIAESAMPFDVAIAHKLHANVLLKSDRAQEAVDYLKAAYENHAAASIALDLFYAQRRVGDMEGGVSTLRDWLTRDPSDREARHALASTLIELNQKQAAAAEFKILVAREPENALLLNNLAWLQFELGEPGAFEMAQRAYELSPNIAVVGDTYAWLLVQSDRTEEALPILRTAASQAPENRDIAYRLAYALQQTGKNAEARAVLDRILEPQEPFAERAKAKALLDRLGG